jgi:hypothetical protein
MNERTEEEVEKDAAEAEAQADAIKEETAIHAMENATDIDSLSLAELRGIVATIRELLWPRDDLEHDWSPDTIAAIASIFEAFGLNRISITLLEEPDDEP